MNAIYIYRLARWFAEARVPLLPRLLKYTIFLVYNSVVPYTTIFGRDCRFAYGAIGVVIHSRAVFGDRVIVGQGVTVGRSIDPEGIPSIGNDVYIGAGARILGGVTVGDNVIIGANSVVTHDVPSNAIVAGVPARLVRTLDASVWDLLKNIY